jgi:single-strand DNA-binding protein
MLNNVSLMGRLTRDPELRHTQSGSKVATFTLACNRDFSSNGQSEADFIDIVAWKKTAEFVEKYFQKGRQVAVEGRLQSRKWQDKDGNNRVAIEIVARQVHFAESKNKGETPPQQYAAASPNEQYGVPGTFAELDDDDGELPF